MNPVTHRSSRGAVLIMVLWTAVILTVLVTVLATNVRLSANTALNHKIASRDLANVMAALNQAEMELLMERMPVPLGQELTLNEDGEFRIPAYRFNGQPLTLHYPTEENMVVRIYDHAGKININRIPRARLQQLIEKQLGPGFNPLQVQELLAAWTDWTDLNSDITPGGAEDDYYLELNPPYRSRNNPDLDSVQEILLIRGFRELFAGVNLDAAFTVYGNAATVNPNLATREALRLLPGLDDDLVEQIIAYRERSDLRTMREVGEIVPLERMVELSPWLGFNTSSVYSVFAYPAAEWPDLDTESQRSTEDLREDPVTHAFKQIMEVRSFNTRARIYQAHPYGRLPDTAAAGLRN
jgi:general secretion pathway protein K